MRCLKEHIGFEATVINSAISWTFLAPTAIIVMSALWTLGAANNVFQGYLDLPAVTTIATLELTALSLAPFSVLQVSGQITDRQTF